MAQVHINGVTYELQDRFGAGSAEQQRLEGMLMRAEEPTQDSQWLSVRVDNMTMALRLRAGGVWSWGIIPDRF